MERALRILIAAGSADRPDSADDVRALVPISVADVVFYLGVEGDGFRFLAVNPAFTAATGLTEEKVVGKRVDEVIPEPSLSLVLSKYREAIEQQRTVRWEEITDYPAGKKYGEVSVTPVVSPDGKSAGLVGTVHDITEERRRDETIRLYADIVSAVQTGLSVWEVSGAGTERKVTLAASNPAAAKGAGVELAAMVARPITEIFPAPTSVVLLSLVSEVAGDGAVRELSSFRFDEGPERERVYSVKAFPVTGGRVGLSFEDVTAQARALALDQAEQRVLEMTASGATLERTLSALVQAIEELAPPVKASVLLLSADGQRLVHGAAPSLASEYVRAIDGTAIGPLAGSCGAAAALGQAVIVTDVEADERWADYRHLARAAGLRACWSTPIVASDGRVLGTFALYYAEPRAPKPSDLEIIARATHVAGLTLERHQLDQQLRGLAGRIEAEREDERAGVAREIHDQLGQALTALKMDLAWIGRRAGSEAGIAPAALLGKVKELSQMTDEIIQQVRRISSDLRPGVLDDLGLTAALSWQAHEFEKRTHIPCVVHASVEDRALSREVSTGVFRVFQEALTNIVRHAEASRVVVRLEAENGALVFRVRDDGKGIRPEDVSNTRSLGLLGIRERARRLGGTADFSPARPTGTEVVLRLPLAGS